MAVFSKITQKECAKDGFHRLTVTIRIVQHCATILATVKSFESF